jgi:hypothetical protein
MNPVRSPSRVGGISILLALFPVSLFVAGLSHARQEQPPAAQAVGSELDFLLARAAEYCDRLNRAVMDFVCRERIEEWYRLGAQPAVRHMRRTIFLGARQDHHYTYDYQLVRDWKGDIKESRTLLKEDKRKVNVPDAPLKTHSFSHARVVMGPIGMLSRENQAEHDYRIVREEKVRGEEAFVVEAVPKPGVRFQHLFGRLWLRKKDAGILKIEWNPASIDNYKGVEKTAQFLGLTPDLLITSEYAFEKNGIRFPSRYILKEAYRRGTSGARYRISEVDAVYDQYKFFTVETDVKY